MEIYDLGGQWRVGKAGRSEQIPAVVPGGIHCDLLAAGVIPDPYYRDNERKLMWIGETDWVYCRRFDVPAELLERQTLLLRCEGLDTLATVKINGKVVGRTDNMFRTYEFDVKRLVKARDNTIEVHFAAAATEAQRLQKKRYVHIGGVGDHRLAGPNRLRKEQCNFGWDWGPMCVTCGIWRPIALVAFDEARLADVHIRQDHSRKGQVRLSVGIGAQRVGKARLTAVVTVSLGSNVVAEETVSLRSDQATVDLAITKPRLWWPNGMGEQTLYEVHVDLLDASEGVLDTWTRRVGLRTMELVREDDRWGQSFYFRVNGVPFFGKGANWIPADTFQTRVGVETYEHLLVSAVEANMNMLRVWGGGIYEEDVFYDLCDELGLCVWQDFMFACAAYPAWDDAFLENVRIEAEQNVRRIRHHPCLTLWCGNNELEQMRMVDDTGSDGRMTWSEYKRLFDKLLPDVVRRLDPDTAYWPSSEHSPCGDRMQTNNPDCGDGHLWSVWHGRKPFEWYRTAMHRFCSEFGFQSFPEPATVESYTESPDHNLTSYVMELHQRSGIGNATIMHYTLSWYRQPVGFENTLWLSQIVQGLAIKYAVEHWRRNMPRCMGAVYWQLNDCWPVASWSSIDSMGRWKALHYMAKKFFAPLLLSAVEDAKAGTVEVHVSSDRLKATAAKAQWTLTTVDGKTLDAGVRPVKVKANGSSKVMTLDFSNALARYTGRNLLVWLELVAGGEVVSRNLVTFARPKHMDLCEPGISASVRPGKDGGFDVTLKTRKPALWAWMELVGCDADYDDNFISLRPGLPVTINVQPHEAMTADEFRRKLRVKSIVDTYRE